MKKRLISLLLAFSMMLTFLPAGAVSAFAEEPIDSSKGTLLHGGETITGNGTYQLNGTYTQGITITEGSVEINVTGVVTGNLLHTEGSGIFSVTTAVPLITIKGGTVTFNGDNSYTVASNALIRNDGGNLTVQGGMYVSTSQRGLHYADCFSLNHGRNLIENVTIETIYTGIGFYGDGEYAEIKDSKIVKTQEFDGNEGIRCKVNSKGIMNLNSVEVMAESNAALQAESGTITINGGKYSSKQGEAIATRYNSGTDLDLTMNGGTYQGDNYDCAVANFGCYVTYKGRKCNIKINGSKFIGGQLLAFYGEGAETLTIDKNTTFQSIGGTYDAVIVGHGQLIFNSGTIEVPSGSERTALRTFEKGEAIVNGGTFKGAKYDIYERNRDVYRGLPPCRVQLNHANFDDDVCNVYLEEDRQIDVAQNYTGQVTIECKDPSDGRQLTKATETDYQKDLNLTSANAGYLVGYKKTTDGKREYRCLSKEVGVTIENLEDAIIKEGESKDFIVKVDPKSDANLGEAFIDFGDKNGEIEYLDNNNVYHRMPGGGLPIKLTSNNNDHAFRITPQKAGDQNLTAAVVRYDVEVGKDSKLYHVAGRVHTAVTIEGLENAVIKEGESKDFTVKVDPKDDANLGEAVIDFGNKNSEIEYKDEESGEYKPMPEGGLKIGLGDGEVEHEFRITPKETGKQTLTAAVKQDKKELAKDEKDFTVAGRVHTAVTIEGLENAVIKEGESKDFTVKVDPKDDANLGEAVIDFGNKNSEIEYKDEESGEYKPMPEGGLKIGLGDGEVEHEFRITPKETGKQTLTAAVKQGEKKLAKDEKDFTVSEMPILTLKDGVITSVTVPGKNGADPEDITEIVKKNANEDGSFHVPEGATVSVAFDKDAFADSGLKFGHWDITGLDDPNAYQDKESFAFEMPAKAVTLKAMTQDASIEDDEPDIVGPIVIGTTVVVGGAVLGYQAYSLGAEFAGKLMALPYFPSNRSALAMMLWEDAGKPMPESELLYPDVGQEERDMDLQHAARWAMENELIPDLNDEGTAPEEMKFYPDNAVSKIDVLNAWQKAQELKQNA